MEGRIGIMMGDSGCSCVMILSVYRLQTTEHRVQRYA